LPVDGEFKEAAMGCGMMGPSICYEYRYSNEFGIDIQKILVSVTIFQNDRHAA
jgi:hypothetical protein